MKRVLPFILFLLLVCPTGPLKAASERENRRLAEGKITKNEAQHLVLKKYPGATVQSAVLTKGKTHGIWVVNILKPGAQKSDTVRVDGQTGEILSPEK